MLDGIYSIAFSSTAGRLGTGGVAAFISGRVYGGDAGYYYKGTVNVAGGSASGQIHVGPHGERMESIFGPLTEFDLQLSGTTTEDTTSFRGEIVGHPGMGIKVGGRKVADL